MAGKAKQELTRFFFLSHSPTVLNDLALPCHAMSRTSLDRCRPSSTSMSCSSSAVDGEYQMDASGAVAATPCVSRAHALFVVFPQTNAFSFPCQLVSSTVPTCAPHLEQSRCQSSSFLLFMFLCAPFLQWPCCFAPAVCPSAPVPHHCVLRHTTPLSPQCPHCAAPHHTTLHHTTPHHTTPRHTTMCPPVYFLSVSTPAASMCPPYGVHCDG